MGFDVNRFAGGNVDEELLCPICSGVLENPVQAPGCEHAFCLGCIAEWLLLRPTCPVDRQEVARSQLKSVPRILKNLLARLEITCDNASHGCEAVVKLDLLSHHLKECEFNPRRPVVCTLGCGQSVPKEELADHNCVKELQAIVRLHEMRILELEQQSSNCDYRLTQLMRDVSLMRDFHQSLSQTSASDGNPGGAQGTSGTDEFPPVIRSSRSRVHARDEVYMWCNSLSRCRVTRWGGMISTPDEELQAQIKRALSESGCPANFLDDLMENAHESRWPPGLLTLETRQINRRLYEKYVCRRVPNKQAVVVMAIDNMHMCDDLILEPGLVMIFAHGIE